MTGKNNKNFFCIILFIIGIATHIQWFNVFSILTHGDWQYRFSEHIRGLYYSWNTWIGFIDFGSTNVILYSFPLRGVLWSFLSNIGFTYDLIIKITLLFPIAILGFLASFILIKKLVNDNLISFTVALFYGTTTYFIILQTAHLPIAFIYSLIPLFFYFFIGVLEKNRLCDWLTFILMYFMGISYDIRIMYIFTFIISGYFFYFYIKKIKKYFKNILISGFFLLLLNFFWFLPTFFGKITENIYNIANRGLFGNFLFDLSHAFTIVKWNWTGGIIDMSFVLHQINWHFWVIPVIVFYGFLLNTKNFKYKKEILFFGIMSLFGIFLTKQAGFPLVDIYKWLYENFPGFNLFREASKFYLITSFGYAGLLGYTLLIIKQKSFRMNKIYIFYCIISLIIILSFWNLKPLTTKEVGTLFVSRHIHSDYLVLKDFILDQDEYFRTFWTPRGSRWSIYTNNYPRVSNVSVSQSRCGGILKRPVELLVQEKMINVYKKFFSNQLFDSTSIKYVIIPIQDIENDDDFFIHYGGRENSDIRNWYINELDKLDYLDKIDIGTKDLVVYENKDYKPHIFAQNKINGLKSFDKLEEKYGFLNNELNNEFIFYDINKKDIVSENVYIPFEIINTSNVNEFAVNDLIKDKNNKSKIYVNKDKRNVIVSYKNSDLKINKIFNNNLNINNKNIDSYNEVVEIYQTDTLGQDLFVEVGSRLISLKNNQEKIDLGIVVKPFDIYSVNENNAIQNPSFENGAWSEKVGDCNAYDDKAILAMEISDESSEGYESIQLEAVSHIACTGQKGILVESEQDYIFGFDYQGEEARHAGYYVIFNDEFETIISERLPIVDEEWNYFQKKLSIPTGATKMSLVIYSYAKDNKINVITRYDNFQLKQLEKIATVDPKYKAKYEAMGLSSADEYAIEYKEKYKTYDNLIKNPSFEKGLWGNKVGDCNNYDDNGKLSMQSVKDEKSDGEHALQLGATRHIACTGPGLMEITEERTYLFSFDYQSPNGKRAGYYLGFNDPDRTVISERIPIKDDKWQNYTKQIKAPFGASAVSLVVYSYASDGKKEIITRYDNFSFIELPDLEDRYFLVTEPKEKFVNPKSVEFELINPTKKKVHIKGASTSFYLAMSESYHDQWQLQMNNKKINGFFNKWVPWVKPDRVSDDQHFELNGFLNGWFVDTAELCQVESYKVHKVESGGLNSACVLNSDGSYDIEMVIEFFPQRWFYLGLLISGTTFLGCIGYLGWDFVRRRRIKRNHEK